MRTDEEILARIKALKDDDLLGFETGDLLSRLSFEVAQAAGILRPDAKPWTVESRRSADLIAEMKSYLAFAWDKALNHRGISAGRSVNHYQSWMWLLGDDEYASIDWERYRNYGAPILRQVTEFLEMEIQVPAYHEKQEAIRMSEGLTCVPGCDSGCAGSDDDDDEELPVVESVDQAKLPEKTP